MNPHYLPFADFIAANPDCDNRQVIRYTMMNTGGKADPNVISEWFQQWRALKKAMDYVADNRIGYPDHLREKS